MYAFICYAAGAVSLGIWGYLALSRGGFWRLRERLPHAGTGEPSRQTVTAVIPARDEAEVIERAVVSLRSQTHTALRIIVANDESSDGTGALARAAGADLVIDVIRRPPQWKGKLWAVHQGIVAETGKPDFFLLTDADIEHVSRDVLDSLIAQANKGYDLVSVMVRLCCEFPAEKFLIPAFVFFFFKLYPPAWVISRPGTAAAAGGCMLLRREMLERIGGIASIRDALIDDCALAAQVKAAGGRVWLGISEPEIRSTRPYRSAREIRTMISRAAFSQLRHSSLLLAGTVLGMSLTYIAPVALLFSGVLPAASLGLAAWLLGAGLFLPTVRWYRAPLWTAFCLPGIALFYLIATLESAINYWRGRGGVWKGRIQDAAG